MCRIVGIVGTLDRDRATEMRAMREAITHRGPDSAGERCDARSALGVRPLRIIDLVTGDQRQWGEDERIWTVFNGEIRNFQELRDELSKQGHTFRTRSDTETFSRATTLAVRVSSNRPTCVSRSTKSRSRWCASLAALQLRTQIRGGTTQ